MDIFKKYLNIIHREIQLIKLQKVHPSLYDTVYFQNLAIRVLDNAKSSTILRCCGRMGHLTEEIMAYESVAAHANLVSAIVDYALDYINGFGIMGLQYSRRTFAEAIRMHDLPENITGDTPDNSTRNEDEKNKEDDDYFRNYISLHPDNVTYRADTLQLLTEMQYQSSPEGKIIYLADKLSAIIMNLQYDRSGHSPTATSTDPGISPHNQEAMKICDTVLDGDRYLLSEVWTIDFLVQRRLNRHDETGFFTALLVMSTLLCHEGNWYQWPRQG